ncbi:MAG: hypothetical protein FWC49_05750, partial [Proteobacteria bacterium]|nr:hypothetical protein [Pseudomonadota bacterium]
EPEELFLSGGLCANPLFVASFPCTVHPLGRFVLLEGLLATLRQDAGPQELFQPIHPKKDEPDVA